MLQHSPWCWRRFSNSRNYRIFPNTRRIFCNTHPGVGGGFKTLENTGLFPNTQRICCNTHPGVGGGFQTLEITGYFLTHGEYFATLTLVLVEVQTHLQKRHHPTGLQRHWVLWPRFD